MERLWDEKEILNVILIEMNEKQLKEFVNDENKLLDLLLKKISNKNRVKFDEKYKKRN